MYAFRSTFIAAVAVSLALAASARSVSAQGKITGHVTAADDGRPLAGARVLVVGSTSVATTGDDGSFTLSSVAAGNWQLQALHVGYQSLKKPVTVAKGEAVNVDFTLTRAVVHLQ